MSAAGGEADEIRAKPDIGQRMSPVGELADVPEACLELRFLAEAVEKVPSIELFEIMIQNPGLD